MTKLALAALALTLAPLAAADPAPAKPAKKPAPAKKLSKVEPVAEERDPYEMPWDRARRALPAAPADPATPAAYDAWKKRLTPAQRQRVERFCRVDRPADYEPHCGGIGLYRIPAPPQLILSGVTQADLVAWKQGLSKVQRRSYEQLCSDEDYAYTQLCGGTPLVAAFDDQQVAFTASSVGPDRPTAATPWLALDRDGDGAITSGAELFGDATVLADGRTARHGFEALATLDSNGDHRIDRADPMFASLVLWADRDGDRRSSPAELIPASQAIESIELGYTLQARCDVRLNCERERSVMHYRDATGASRTGAIVDVYLHHR